MYASAEYLAFSRYLKSCCCACANFIAESFNRAVSSSYAAIATFYIPGLFGGLKACAVINDVPCLSPRNFMDTTGVIDINPQCTHAINPQRRNSGIYRRLPHRQCVYARDSSAVREVRGGSKMEDESQAFYRAERQVN